MASSDEHELYGHPADESPQQTAYDAAMAIREVVKIALPLGGFTKYELMSALALADLFEEKSK